MRYACQLVLFLLVSASMGCAMCQDTFDEQYAAYGGLRDRLDRVNGRVGSVFDPAASLEAAPRADEPQATDEGPMDQPEVDFSGESTGADAEKEGFADEVRDALQEAQDSLPDPRADET